MDQGAQPLQIRGRVDVDQLGRAGDDVTARASLTLGRVSLQDAAQLNTVDLAQYAKIIVSSKALEAILARANGGKN